MIFDNISLNLVNINFVVNLCVFIAVDLMLQHQQTYFSITDMLVLLELLTAKNSFVPKHTNILQFLSKRSVDNSTHYIKMNQIISCCQSTNKNKNVIG